MPIFNSDKYLKRAIDSVLEQSYNNIELLLIDDGSTDFSGIICDKYVCEDSRVRVIHKKNGGVSTARNVGIECMGGYYCQFMDSDDYIPKNYIECLVNKMEEDLCDVVFCGVARVKDGQRREFFLNDDVLSVEQYIYELYLAKKFVTKSSCIGLYKTEIIKEYKLNFSEEIICGEDSLFVLQYISHVKRVGTINDVLYDYMYDNVHSATTAIYYDHFLVEQQRYDIANRLITNVEIKENVAQFYMDNEIREIVQYIKYSQDKIPFQLSRLKDFVNNANNQYAINYYKRDSKKKSLWIPITIREKRVLGLFLLLRRRSSKMAFKASTIRSIYKRTIE